MSKEIEYKIKYMKEKVDINCLLDLHNITKKELDKKIKLLLKVKPEERVGRILKIDGNKYNIFILGETYTRPYEKIGKNNHGNIHNRYCIEKDGVLIGNEYNIANIRDVTKMTSSAIHYRIARDSFIFHDRFKIYLACPPTITKKVVNDGPKITNVLFKIHNKHYTAIALAHKLKLNKKEIVKDTKNLKSFMVKDVYVKVVSKDDLKWGYNEQK